MKVIEREFLAEVSGAGGRNDPPLIQGVIITVIRAVRVHSILVIPDTMIRALQTVITVLLAER